MIEAETRVGLIGCGAIGKAVAAELMSGRVPGCTLVGVHARGRPREDIPFHEDPDDLMTSSDLLVEAAGHAALAALGPPILEADLELLVVSAGALVDDQLRQRLTNTAKGRLMISTGAIGGMDTLRAAALAGDLTRVALTTTKPSRVIIEDWMSDDMKRELQRSEQRVTAFAGSAREAVRLFPRSVNVAATVSLVTRGFDLTEVRVVGDPRIDFVEHVIDADTNIGSYQFRFRNDPSVSNPRTSAITAYAVLRSLHDRSARVSIGV